jgi:hypothetical protein
MHIQADMIVLIALAVTACGAWSLLKAFRVLKALFLCAILLDSTAATLPAAPPRNS